MTRSKKSKNNDTQEIVNDLQSVQPSYLPVKLRSGLSNVIKTVKRVKSLTTTRLLPQFWKNNDAETVNEDSDGDADKPLTCNSHTGARNAFDIALQYIEQNSTSTLKDIL